MVKKWKSRKWYFCTIMDEACQDSTAHMPEPPDCDNCPVYHDWKNEKKNPKEKE